MRKFSLVLISTFLPYIAVCESEAQKMAEALYANEFNNCGFAVMAVTDKGEKIVSLNEARLMNPGSNMKVVTTAAALAGLGEDYVWKTNVSYSGSIDSNGTLKGNIHIVGGGDPLLGSCNGRAPEIDFSLWMNCLKDAGIKAIDGAVMGDGSWIEGMREEPSWYYMDLGTYYGTCVSGLNFYENCKDIRVTPGKKEGEPLKDISPGFPDTPWMKWNYDCSTGTRGSGDRLYLYLDHNGTEGTVRGTLAAGLPCKNVKFRNNNPELTVANEFCKYLVSNGIPVKNGALPFDGCKLGRTCAGISPSLPLSEVVRETNRHSNNFCAEILFRTLGYEANGHNDIESARKALAQLLPDKLKVMPYPNMINIVDGSGLSTQTRCTAEFICNVLRAAMDCGWFDVFRESLVKISERVYLKTGTLSGCRALCGYILPASEGGDTIIFSIMVNNSPLGFLTLDKKEKQLIELLSIENR